MTLTPIQHGFKKGSWAGKPAFIIGGGPSLLGLMGFEILRHQNVIACNRAHECGVASLVVTGDRRWLSQYLKNENMDPSLPLVYAYRGPLTWVPEHPVYVVKCSETRLWGRHFEEGITHGDTGIRATNIAAILGADPIYLLGFDMKGAGKQEWWHNGYPRTDALWYASFIERWRLVMESGQVTQRIINLRPDGEQEMPKLSCLPFVSWADVLWELEKA